MDTSIIRFHHCGHDIYCFFVPDQCPECGESLSGRRLEEAPVSVPNPFSNAHKTPCAFVLATTEGEMMRDLDAHADLHTGITNTKGVVYNYTRAGVQREGDRWQRSICVPLVPPHTFSLISQWDQYLDKFSSHPSWDTQCQSFHEENHNCFSFSLSFINCVLAIQSKPPLSKQLFTRAFVLPRFTRASKYLTLCRQITHNHFYTAQSPHGAPEETPDQDK